MEPKRRSSQRLVGIPTKKVSTNSKQSAEETELSLSNFTLPMLTCDQVSEVFQESFTFGISNPLFDKEEAQDAQILMSLDDIDTYNNVIKRIETVNKDKNNHFVFEYEMASYLAHKDSDKIQKLHHKIRSGAMPLRAREKKPLDDFFHDEHDISKCAKNWRFQMRVFNETNGFVDAEYESPACLIRPTWAWKFEYMMS